MKKLLFFCILILAGEMLALKYLSVPEDNQDVKPHRTSTVELARRMKAETGLATTRVKVSKLVIWDEKQQTYEWYDFMNNIKNLFGNRVFIFPVSCTFDFGYDLSSFSSDDIKVAEGDSSLIITLPAPKFLHHEFDKGVNNDKLVEIATGLRKNVSTTDIRVARQACQNSMLEAKDSILNSIKAEVMANAELVFSNLLQGTGWGSPQIVHKTE